MGPSSPSSAHLGQGDSALGPYLRAIRSHRLIVAVVVAAAVLGSVAWLQLRTPDYEATAQMLVTPLPQDDKTFLGLQLLRDSGEPTRTVQTAAALIASPEAARRTARRLDGGLTGQAVLDQVEVKPQGDSNILAVTGTGSSASGAARLANAFTLEALNVRRDQLRSEVQATLAQLSKGSETPGATPQDGVSRADRISQLEAVRDAGDPTLSLAQRATLPTAPAGAAPIIVIGLALIGGLALGAGAALVLELLDPRIRDEDEALAIYPLPVLARVPLLPKGRRLTRTTDAVWYYIPPLVREAFRTLLVQLRHAKQGEGARTLMITSGSTGDGKTSSAINLAISLSAAGERVLLMDLDLRKPDVARRIPAVGNPRVSSLLREDLSLQQLVVRPAGLPSLSALLPDASGADPALIESLYHRLPALLDEARTLADYVVIDTAPLGEVSDALRIADAVDDLIVAVRPGNTNRAHLEAVRELLDRLEHPPLGYLMVGWSTTPTTSAYGYGMQGRELVVGRGSSRP